MTNPFSDFPHVVYGVSTAADGNMSYKWGPREEVYANRRKFFGRLGVDAARCVMMHVPHEDNIAVIDASMLGKGMAATEDAVEVDGFVTTERNVFLCLLTADCLPVAFFDPAKNVIALGHLGWRSTAKHLSKKIVGKLRDEFGVEPSTLLVAMGPGIHAASYVKNLEPDMERPEWPEPYVVWVDERTFRTDIVAANHDQLVSAGVPPKNIADSPADTAASPDYFSHYRSNRTGEPERRFMTVIGTRNMI